MRKLLFAVILAIAGIATTDARNISGRCDTLNIVTRHVPSPAPVTVVVPEKYLSAGDTCRYNVVYLLHGYGDDYTGYAKGMPLDSLADRHQVIFVCPDGLTSWYWDSPVDTTMQMESYIIHDLIPTIDSRLRTVADRTGRSIAGLSMGGHGAMWLAMRHKDLFAATASMSGGLDISRPEFKEYWEMWRWLGPQEENRQLWRRHTALSLVPTLNPDELDMMVVCGDEDFFFKVNQRFHYALENRGIAHRYEISPGGHTWDYWSRMLPRILDFFAESRQNRGR